MAIHPYYWNKATEELGARDEIMADLIATYKGETLSSHGDPFVTLVRAILGQQISVKAADAIWEKMTKGLGGPLTPDRLIDANDDLLRSFGLSKQKIMYLRHLAAEFLEHKFHPEHWNTMSDEEVMADLIRHKGIGRWTAEMFMIFHLMRPDILPLADIGLRKAVAHLYNFGEDLTKEEIEAIATVWAPWRTVATWYLWRSLDPVPVAY